MSLPALFRPLFISFIFVDVSIEFRAPLAYCNSVLVCCCVEVSDFPYIHFQLIHTILYVVYTTLNYIIVYYIYILYILYKYYIYTSIVYYIYYTI